MDFVAKRDLAARAARAAGNQMMKNAKDAAVFDKARHDVVTTMDLANENLLRDLLLAACPQDGFLGEETGTVEGREGMWIVDPIDGTNNFVHRLPYYVISVAWQFRGELCAGAVYNPVTGEMFCAAKGSGAYLNGKPIHVTGVDDPNHALINFSFGMRQQADFERTVRSIAKMGDVADFRRLGSAAYECCLVACGKSDGFFERGLHVYDFGAGAVILREAGGTVTGWPGEEDFLTTGNLLASNGKMHPYLTACLA
ncbi:MAG: inositol monophosphatase [Clostridia bacterium]|nr:inositol monophosphatase [Clostridia bacterium]